MGEQTTGELLDWFKRCFAVHTVASAGGGIVRYATLSQEDVKTEVVVVPGRTEFIEKYLELAADLQDLRTSFCLLDHFGQGRSTRPLEDRQKGHVESFDVYVEDLANVLSARLAARRSGRMVALAHSMGGLIATLTAIRHPQMLDGLVLVSPMFQINTGPLLPSLVAGWLSGLACLAGACDRYVPGGGPFDAGLAFAGNDLTGDGRRFARNQQFMIDDPELALGHPTFGWLHQASRAMSSARSHPNRLECPVLALVGDADRVVGLPAVERFVAGAAEGRIVRYPGARHEILMEQDAVRDQALTEIRNFVDMLAQRPMSR